MENTVQIQNPSSRYNYISICGTWWQIGWVGDFQPEGRGFHSRSSRHVGTLSKSFT